MELNKKKSRKLVLVPFPLQGHITPMLQLGGILNSRGFSVTIAHTHFNSPNPSNHPHFNFLPLPYGLSSLDPPPTGLVSFMLTLKSTCEAPLLEFMTRNMQEEAEDDGNHSMHPPPCIIYDGLMNFVESVARQLNIPSISMSCGSAANLLMYQLFPSLKINDSKLDDLVPELHPIRFKDIPIKDFSKDDLLWLAAQSKQTSLSSAIILNTLDCLEKSFVTQLQHHSKTPVFSIGPMHKIAPPSNSNLLEEDTTCLEWLDRQSPKSVIYVSLGSMAFLEGKELEEMAWGLASSNQPFLWVIRAEPRSDPFALLPSNFTGVVGGQGRGYIVNWAPQKLVLAHPAVGGFWSHCGWNSTLESIAEGVPMICRPYFGDQMVNARLASHMFGVGFEIEGEMGRREIERAIRRLMVDPEGEELRKKATNLKRKFDLSVKESGSSYKSSNDLVDFLRC